jgi:hypothetical protein
MIDVAKHLQVGQTVRLEALAGGYQITPLSAAEPGLAVTMIGPDYVVLDDAEAGVRTRIPSHCLTFTPAPAAPAPLAA